MSVAVPSRPSPFRQKTLGTGVGDIQGAPPAAADGKAFQQATLARGRATLSRQDSLENPFAPPPQRAQRGDDAVLDKHDEMQKWLQQERRRVAAKKKKKNKTQTGKGSRKSRRRARRRTRRRTRRKHRRRTRRKQRRKQRRKSRRQSRRH